MSKKNWFKENFKYYWPVLMFLFMVAGLWVDHWVDQKTSDVISKIKIEEIEKNIEEIKFDVDDNLKKVVYIDRELAKLEERVKLLKEDVIDLERRTREVK